MAKAMLIMDNPSCCGKCDISVKVKSKIYVRCPILKRVVYKFENCIPNDCPLREVPTKKSSFGADSLVVMGQKLGYNACIDEILGSGE